MEWGPIVAHMDTTTISILIALAAVALTLAGLIIGAFASLRSEFRTELRAINARLLALEQGQARLLGFREGFAEAVGLGSARPTVAAEPPGEQG